MKHGYHMNNKTCIVSIGSIWKQEQTFRWLWTWFPNPRDAKYPWMPNTLGIFYPENFSISGSFFVSEGIWDAKYPWNNLPQNTSATLGERFAFSNLFAVSRISKGAPQKKTESNKNGNPLNHYIVEKETFFCEVWRKEGPRMCWVVGGFGKKNLGRNFNCFALTWDAKYPRNNLPGTLWYVWVYSVCLRCQGSLEELYIGSRAPKKKTESRKNGNPLNQWG